MRELSRRTALSLLIAAPAVAIAGCSADERSAAGGATPATTAPSGVQPSVFSEVGDLSTAEFGPTGTHWPSRTPAPTDQFDVTIEVDAKWSAISAGIAQAIAKSPKGNVRVLVRPGVLGGNGAGSTKTPVIKNVGVVGRPSRALVMPRDGVGTVTFSDSIRIELVRGVSFVGFWLGTRSMVVSAVQDFAWAWSRGQAFNLTSNSTQPTKDVEFVECVTPDARLIDADTWALRSGGQPYSNVSIIGCYLAPSYKNAGSGAHCDTIQLSGDDAMEGLNIRDTVIFSSTNAGLIPSGGATGIVFDHSLVIGSDRMLQRYPLPAGANAFTSGLPAAVNGVGSVDQLSAVDSTFVGNVRGVWKSVEATSTSLAKPPAVTSGSFTSDTSLSSIDGAWIDTRSPFPTDERLKAAWTLSIA
jgi:hypothetical protein